MSGGRKIEKHTEEHLDDIIASEYPNINLSTIKNIDKQYTEKRSGLFSKIVQEGFDDGYAKKGVSKQEKQKTTEETVQLQKELDAIMARVSFVPNVLLQKIADPIIQMKKIQKLIETYPIRCKTRDRLLDDCGKVKKHPDPHHIISFLKLVHKDILQGKIHIYDKKVIMCGYVAEEDKKKKKKKIGYVHVSTTTEEKEKLQKKAIILLKSSKMNEKEKKMWVAMVLYMQEKNIQQLIEVLEKERNELAELYMEVLKLGT